MGFVVTQLVRCIVFGIAIAFVTRQNSGVTVQPRSALPVVALVFTLLNALLYGALKTVINFGTLFVLFLVVPFIANAILLWVTDKLMKSFKVEGLGSLAFASLIVTAAHFLLRFALHI
jgi:uncharacterized membrane protein YvlD (DUF360 family)